MLTIVKLTAQTLKFQANPRLLNHGQNVNLLLRSSSRPLIEIQEKPVTALGAGFFSIQVNEQETNLIDDTYSFIFANDEGVKLAQGFVRLKPKSLEDNGVFDYLLDFLLA